jgi:uncharacterized protein (DUF1330 family)
VSLSSVTLCVLLWAHDGGSGALTRYEDEVLPLVAEHGGQVLQRARTTGQPDAGEPQEVHLIRFPSQAAFDAYLGDERRTRLADQRHRAVARTQVLRVELA